MAFRSRKDLGVQKRPSTRDSVHREPDQLEKIVRLPRSPSRSCYLLSPLMYLVVLRTFTPRKRRYSRYIFVMSQAVNMSSSR